MAVSSADFISLMEGSQDVHSLVYKDYRRGESIQPCGASMLMVLTGRVPAHTNCLLSIRKSTIHWQNLLHSVVAVSCGFITALKAELKSTNMIPP